MPEATKPGFSFLWPPYLIGQDIIFLSCGFFFFLSIFCLFFRAYSQPSQIGCLPYFHTWCGFCANLGCRSETCCTRLSENTERKNSPSAQHPTTLSGYIFATTSRTRYRQSEKKLVKQQYLSHMSSQ